MQSEETTADQSAKRKKWLIIFVVSLTVTAIFWSVDPSILYILAGFIVFSLFKVLQNQKIRRENIPPFEQSYQKQDTSNTSSFWDELKSLFNKPSSKQSPQQQSKFLIIIIAGFIGFIFFTVIVSAVFSDDPSSDSSEARQQASDLYNRQQYDSASTYYRIAISRDPENADLYLELGNALLNSDKTDSALIFYDKALLIRPSYPEAQYNKSLIYYNRKQYRKAIDEAKRAIDLNPEYTDAMLMAGDSFYNQSQLDSAMGWYETAYEKGYRSAGLSHVMAYIYDTKGQAQKAIPLYKEAISYDTTRTEIYKRLGELVQGEEGNVYRQKAARYQ